MLRVRDARTAQAVARIPRKRLRPPPVVSKKVTRSAGVALAEQASSPLLSVFKMSGWEEGNQRMEGMPIRAQEPGSSDPEILQARFANFLKNFTENAQNYFLYREQLVSQNEVQLDGNAFIRVQLDHLIMFDRDLSERLIATPAKIIHDFEVAAGKVYFELTQNRRQDDSMYCRPGAALPRRKYVTLWAGTSSRFNFTAKRAPMVCGTTSGHWAAPT